MTGPEFKALCEQHGFSPYSLAKQFGVGAQTIYNIYERDKVKPHYIYAFKYLLLQPLINEQQKISSELNKVDQVGENK